MALNPQAQFVLEAIEKAERKGYRKPLIDCTPAEARAQATESLAGGVIDPPDVALVVDGVAPGPAGDIPVRSYRPAGSASDVQLPVLIYYHGGGWVIGDLETHDSLCRMLANAGGFAVVAVDYRMGPEARFPAAVEDAFAALAWVASGMEGVGVDVSRIAVSGDSAGGNLAAVVALMARDAGGPAITFQALVYPATNFDMKTASHSEFGEGHLLTRDAQIWFHDHYLNGDADKLAWRASPALAADHSSLPPALVLTAECDPLRDEGAAYAEKLKAAGVDVAYSCYAGQIHNFFNPPVCRQRLWDNLR